MKLTNIDMVNLLITNPTEKKILCVKRSRNDKTFPNMWALLGGSIEKRETTKEAAKRELCEETGIALKSIDQKNLLTSPLNISDKTYNIGVFKAEIDKKIFLHSRFL